MTPEQKELLIEKMIDRPESLSSNEISLIIADDELRDLYDISARLADEYSATPQVDIDAEWNSLRGAIIAGGSHKRRRPVAWLAAAVAGLVICGGAVRFALSETPASISSPSISSANVAQELSQVETPAQAVVQSLVDEAGAHIAQTSNPAIARSSRTVRARKPKTAEAPSAEEIDIEEYLRVEQARIDNEVAMELSKVYRAQFEVKIDLIVEMLVDGRLEDYDAAMQYLNEIDLNQLTML